MTFWQKIQAFIDKYFLPEGAKTIANQSMENSTLNPHSWPDTSTANSIPTVQAVSPIIIPLTEIQKWANAIAKWEGDKTGLNPGNMKYTTLTKSWGATQGRLSLDGGYFALFATYEQGFIALCNFLTLACEGELLIAHKPCTFQEFTDKYAGNPPLSYMLGIAHDIGCLPETDISTFLP